MAAVAAEEQEEEEELLEGAGLTMWLGLEEVRVWTWCGVCGLTFPTKERERERERGEGI